MSSPIASSRQSRPDPWHDLPEAMCFDSGPAFADEKVCVASAAKRFGSGGTQVFPLFCNASREGMDKRWQDMQKAGAGQAELLAWPAGS